ncbi:lung adenoma susceptibility protein 2 [Dendropsophus ebraccatus]|uniref:lung adenoma susceptibility protein 2 n=1 Tax=Dendropsophus ebraccatus TaxID=150705 RepID=UPI0038322275
MATSSSSPDSSISISSLLASCSLGSSSRSDGARTAASIQYKDRLYDSASKALQDYIEDYEAASTGRISIRPSATVTPPPQRARPSVRRSQSLTRSRYVAHDPELLSLTTDDLLGFPSDGSLPFSQASERKRRKNLKKQYGFSPNVAALASPVASSSLRRTDVTDLDLRDHRLHFTNLQRSREKNQVDYLLRETKREHNSGLYNKETSMLHKSYPRWLTSHKSDLGVSGITSIPDVKYPIWLRDHRLLDDIDSHITRTLYKDGLDTKIHKSLGLMDHSQRTHCEQQGYRRVKSGTFTNSISHSDRSDLDIMENLHTPMKNYHLQKTGGITHKDVPQQPPPNDRSPRTEDILEAERSWEKIPYTYKSPVHIQCEDVENKGPKSSRSNLVADFLKDCARQENTTNTFSGGNHHGPVEALKHILFNMQAFQQNFNQETNSEHFKEFQKVSTEAESEIQRMDQEIFPVNKSLQKALQHLSRLKELVGDCNLRKKEDHKEDLQT